MPMKRITVTVTEEMYERLKVYRNRVNVSFLVRCALEEELRMLERTLPPEKAKWNVE